MVKFVHRESLLVDAVNLSRDDRKRCNNFLDTLIGDRSVTWCMERVWIDEQLSDNAKCHLLFTLGRLYNDDEN